MFKFDFKITESSDETSLKPKPNDPETSDPDPPAAECEEIQPNAFDLERIDTDRPNFSMLISNQSEIVHISELDSIESTKSASDLIPGIYEGGLKVWECTHDLLDFLTAEETAADFAQKKVLDLGCGAGLLGILALQEEATVVHFQDYNADVLRRVTMPNIVANDLDLERSRFFCGDWSGFAERGEIYDLILTSETIYNERNYGKLLKVFEKCLKEDGVIFLAAKSYYFGVGGGLRSFEAALEAHKGFETSVVWKTAAGVTREILKITKVARNSHTDGAVNIQQ